MTSSRSNEVDYQRAFLARASLEFRDVRLFRRNVGNIKVDDRYFRASIPGQCDIYVIGRGGWHGEIEVKRFTGLSPAQVAWRDWCASWGVPWLCISVEKGEPIPVTIARWLAECRAWLSASR